MRFNEVEDRFEFTAVSCANQAAAVARISRSSLSCRLALRKRGSCSRSALVSPSLRLPSSRPARATQLMIDWAVGSNFRDSSSGVRPARPFARETPVDRVFSPLISWTPFIVRFRFPRKRVKTTSGLFRRLYFIMCSYLPNVFTPHNASRSQQQKFHELIALHGIVGIASAICFDSCDHLPPCELRYQAGSICDPSIKKTPDD